MTKQEARAWLRAFGDLPDALRHPCRHGHSECSITCNGECLDEVLQAGVVQIDEVKPIQNEVTA